MNRFFWVVLAAVALSGFFALVNCALRAFRRVQLEEAFSGPSGQKRLETLERHLKSLRLMTAFCRAAANLVLVVGFVYLWGAPNGDWWRPVLGMVCAAAVIAVFGVAIPQAWASYAGEKVLSETFAVLLGLRYALYPITALMGAFDLPVRRLSGVADDEQDDNGEVAKQEILQAASEGQAEGAVDAEEVHMIESVMELGETRAAEIMTPRTDIFALSVNMGLQQACDRVIQAGHTRVPIYEGDIDNIIGILYAKDLLQPVRAAEPPPLRDVMRVPFFVPETKPLDDLLRTGLRDVDPDVRSLCRAALSVSMDDESLDEACDLLGADIALAHAKDLSHDGDAGHEAAGTGVLDYDYYLAGLRRCGYDGALVTHSLSEAQVPACVEFLRTKLQSIETADEASAGTGSTA